MTATTHSIVQRKPSNWSPSRKAGGSAAVTGTSFVGVSSVRAALDVCSAAWKTEHVVTDSSIGKASSVQAS